jgi:hypothetical protein
LFDLGFSDVCGNQLLSWLLGSEAQSATQTNNAVSAREEKAHEWMSLVGLACASCSRVVMLNVREGR